MNRPLASGGLIPFLCTEHKCFSKCAFCLNIATQRRQANGFSPVWTRRCVFKFHDMPNCLPQYSHRYSRTGAALLLFVLPLLLPVSSRFRPLLLPLDPLVRPGFCVCGRSKLLSDPSRGFVALPKPSTFDVGRAASAAV